MPDDDPQPIEIIIEPSQQAGVWANVANVTRSEHEFTLDFIRLDHSVKPPRGIVVSRVAFSPLLASQLADLLMDAWQRYARGALLEDEKGDDDDGPGQEPPSAET